MKFKFTLLAVLFFCFTHLSIAQNKTLRLGIVVDCKTTKSNYLTDKIFEETKALLQSDYDVILDKEDILFSNCNAIDAKKNLDLLLANSNIDIIIGVDAIISHVMATNGPYQKPVLACIVINPQLQKLPYTIDGTSGVENLSYIVLPYSPERDIEMFHEMVHFKNLAVVLDEATFKNIPVLGDFLVNNFKKIGVEHQFIFAETNIESVLNQITDKFDAVYILPSDQLSTESEKQLIEGINAKKLPSFSLVGRPDVDKGVMAGLAPLSNLDRLTRRVALNIQRITNKEKPQNIKVSLSYKEELVINMATARMVDYSPNWNILSEALLVNEERTDIKRTISIYSAIEEGLRANLDFRIAQKNVQVAEQEVELAKSNLLPQAEVSASHTLVNEKTAEVSNGQNPENKGLASAQINQVVFSEQANANKSIQKFLLQSSEAEMQVEALNVILDVSEAYLNLLRTKTAEKIQKQNLEVTRKNFELSKVSSSLGQSGPSDVYRLQSEISTAKANLLNASAQRAQAEMALNRLLYRAISERFLTDEVDISDPKLVINDDRVGQYINNPRDFEIYAAFLVSEAMNNLPLIKQIDFNLLAQERSRVLASRNLYLPSVSLGGGANYELYRNGAGVDFPPGFAAPEDYSWSVQLGASLPIFTGFQRKAQLQQSKIQVDILKDQLENTKQQLEQQTRSVLENVRASYTNIGLTQDAAEAAQKNFELIQDSYSKGAVIITQLLDAQNAAISARLNKANAVYLFLIDLLTLERSTGTFYMLMTEDQKINYSDRLKEFYNTKQQ